MNFEQYTSEANKLVKEIAHELGNPNDTGHAYRVMRSVFHTLREVLSPEESLHLIAQLPFIIKGVYVDGWHLPTKDRIRSMTEFLECLRNQNQLVATRDFGNDETATHHTKCVFNVLKMHVAAGEMKHVIHQFPRELTALWVTEEDDQMAMKQ